MLIGMAFHFRVSNASAWTGASSDSTVTAKVEIGCGREGFLTSRQPIYLTWTLRGA